MISTVPLSFEFSEFTGFTDATEEIDIVSLDQVFHGFSTNAATIQFNLDNNNNNNNNNRAPATPKVDQKLSRSYDEYQSGFGTMNEKRISLNLAQANNYSWKQPRTPTTPVSFAVANNKLLKTKDIASKVTGKRPLLNDADFPPVSYSLIGSGSKKSHTNSSANHLSSMSAAATVKSNTSYFNYSTNNSQMSSERMQFVPQIIDESTLQEQQFWCYFSCDLQLQEIIIQMDEQLQLLSKGKFENNSHQNHQHSTYQQMHVIYNQLEYTWKFLYCQSAEQCEVKIQIFHVIPNSSSRANVRDTKHYIVNFDHIDGDTELFKMTFEHLKAALGTYEDSWAKDLTVSVKSKCVLMSPEDYYYYQHHAKDETYCSSTSGSYVTPNTSEKCREFYEELTSSGKYLNSKPSDALTHAEFFADPTNIDFVDQWVLQIYQYETKEQQYQAIKNICHLCHGAHHESRLLYLLEQLGVIEALLTVFTPLSNPEKSLPGEQPQVAQVNHLCDEELYFLKPYVIQILLYFAQREQSAKKMVNDSHLIDFLNMIITSTHQQQQQQQPQQQSSSMYLQGKSTQRLSLQWMKLSHDCESLSQELITMIPTEEAYDLRSASDDLHTFSRKGGNSFNSSNHQLKSEC